MPEVTRQIIVRAPETEQELQDYYHLRWRILRAPWQQPEGSEKDNLEEHACHCIATVDKNIIVGTGRINKYSEHKAQIRYMAVEHNMQRTGIGGLILEYLENRARDWRINIIELNARNSHLNFYLKHGYEITGKGHTLFNTIEHSIMRKKLS